MNTKRMMAIALTMMMALPALSLVGIAQEENENRYAIVTEEGTIDAPGTLGGGEYFFIKFGTDEYGMDTLFGITWGTQGNENTVSLVTVQSRYLAMAEVHGERDDAITRPIKVQTMNAVKLGSLIEFDDVNDDGLASYVRTNIDDETGDIDDLGTDVFFNKRVSMTNAWTSSEPVMEIDDETGEKRWSFTLTAENLTYQKINQLKPWSTGDENITGETLEKVELTFHLRAHIEDVNGVELPRYSIRVHQQQGTGAKSSWEISSVEDEEPVTNATGKKAMYDMKWDSLFEGWNFNQNNQNPRLIMESRSFTGNNIPPVMAQWMRENQEQLMNRLGEGGEARYQDENGTVRDNGTTQEPTRYRHLHQNRIEYGGDWSNIGRFTWMSNVTVDGQEGDMYFQAQAGVPYTADVRGKEFKGFAMMTGLSYPGGDSIYHDPEIGGDTYLEINTSSPVTNGFTLPPGLFLVGAIAVVVVVALVAVKGGKKNKGYYEQYDRPSDDKELEPDWDKYYRK